MLLDALNYPIYTRFHVAQDIGPNKEINIIYQTNKNQ